MIYIIPKNLKEEYKIFNKPMIYLKDLVTIGVLAVIFWMISTEVHSFLIIPFWCVAAISAFYLVIPARQNPRKRNWEAILYLISKNYATYYSLNRYGGKTNE